VGLFVCGQCDRTSGTVPRSSREAISCGQPGVCWPPPTKRLRCRPIPLCYASSLWCRTFSSSDRRRPPDAKRGCTASVANGSCASVGVIFIAPACERRRHIRASVCARARACGFIVPAFIAYVRMRTDMCIYTKQRVC
jgi:hypothetical protein